MLDGDSREQRDCCCFFHLRMSATDGMKLKLPESLVGPAKFPGAQQHLTIPCNCFRHSKLSALHEGRGAGCFLIRLQPADHVTGAWLTSGVYKAWP